MLLQLCQNGHDFIKTYKHHSFCIGVTLEQVICAGNEKEI